MMMPANFSAISENEMTYVNGGASLSDILAPSLTLENWKKFNTNMVTIIGNSVRRRLQARQPGQGLVQLCQQVLQ